ncbi:MAG: hypothetical protein JO317_06985, partial [Verrucomicrobiae bacterium]|nr:hypothetical protein [Verrucomicrobiae bacterium]
NAAELAEAIDLAFDYRGDVTVVTHDGRQLSGYVYNRVPETAQPYLTLFPTHEHEHGSAKSKIPYSEVAAIIFSGEDTAFGKSWDAWAKKGADQRRAEAQRQAGDAAARGHL